jgi:hypothetical protein
MRQKTKNHRNQGSNDKKVFFLDQSQSRLPRWVHVVQKTRAKNSHAWAPLSLTIMLVPTICLFFGAALQKGQSFNWTPDIN